MIGPIKSVGFRDMHQMQVKALTSLMGVALELAVQIDDQELLDNVEADCNELLQLFGGNGVKVTVASE